MLGEGWWFVHVFRLACSMEWFGTGWLTEQCSSRRADTDRWVQWYNVEGGEGVTGRTEGIQSNGRQV